MSPKITDDFHSLSDSAWYGAAFFLSSSAPLPTWGKVFQKFNVKRVFLLALLLFGTGSAISASASQSAVLIFGRAVAGLGASGIAPGVITIVAHVVPLRRRPAFTGGLTSLAGVFTAIDTVC